jgi:hypothetical protein
MKLLAWSTAISIFPLRHGLVRDSTVPFIASFSGC